MRLTLLLFLLLHNALYAKEPKIELGLGVATLYYPNYIGSSTYNLLSTPIPFVRYRGDYFKIDKDGLTGKLFGINDLKIELSVSGSLPASSEKGSARDGMPDLDLTGEVGFQFVYNIYEKGVSQLEFELPLRGVLSTDFTSISYRGLVSNPQLKYSLNYTHFEWTIRSGVILGDEDYNSYYYSVDKEYVTPLRKEYRAEAGFNGFKNRVGMTYQKGSWWAGAFISYISLNGTVIDNSPLVETKKALYTGASIAYIFYTVD